jgi:hypothetical protein
VERPIGGALSMAGNAVTSSAAIPRFSFKC